MHDIIRRCRFRTTSHRYSLTMWDTGKTDNYHKFQLGYELKQDGKVLFVGEDYFCSPCHAIDSGKSVACLMSFLTLRPGDTDEDYFANYTPEQMDYARGDAEELSLVCMYRFGEC